MSAQLASHYDRAGATREAVPWYATAAAEAQRVYASHEAVRLLSRALALVPMVAAARERNEHELALVTALLVPLSALEGNVSNRLVEAQRRALELTHALEVEPPPPLLRSLALTTLSQGRFEQARDVGRQLHARGAHDENDMILVEGHYVLGISAFWHGELESAQRHFEAAVARYRPEYRAAHLVEYGQDPKVICLSRLGNTLWFLGRPQAARRARDSALALAAEIGHPLTHTTALVFAALLALELRDADGVRAYVAALAAVRGDAELKVTDVGAEAYAGYVDVLDGRQTGLRRIERAVEQSRGVEHAPGMHAFLVRLLVEACVVAGDPRAGLAAAELRLASEGGAGLWEAEIRRLRAEFLAAVGGPDAEVEAELLRALAVARRQSAKSLELRVAASLLQHRLKRADGRGAREARERLAAVLTDLPEAGSTSDRDEAEALLRQP